MLYKLKTAKVFDASKSKRVDDDDDECMFAVQLIRLCVESRLLCVAGYTHVILFKFSKLECAIEYPVGGVGVMEWWSEGGGMVEGGWWDGGVGVVGWWSGGDGMVGWG